MPLRAARQRQPVRPPHLPAHPLRRQGLREHLLQAGALAQARQVQLTHPEAARPRLPLRRKLGSPRRPHGRQTLRLPPQPDQRPLRLQGQPGHHRVRGMWARFMCFSD